MEIVMPQTVAPAAQAGASAQGGKASGGGHFLQKLVEQINGSIPVSGEAKEGAQPVISQQTAAQQQSISLPTLEELAALIEALIQGLDESGPDEEQPIASEADIAELEAAVDQLSALLALLGVPAVILQQTALEGSDMLQNEAQTAQQAAALKGGLQDLLMGLQDALMQGGLKHVQKQEPTVIVAQQLQTLSDMVNKLQGKQGEEQTAEGAKAEALFQAVNGKPSDTGAFLERLSRQSSHQSMAVSAAAVENSEHVQQTEQTTLHNQQPVQAMQNGTNQADPFRNAFQMASRVPAAPVPAEQFANTMSGMIVQRFDIATLNGVSEAKLMLFPEHLGQVDVKISMQNGVLTAVFHTDTAMAKDMLENQMAQLRAALQTQGLVVDKLEVAQSSAAAGLFSQNKGHGNGQQQFENKQSTGGEDGAAEAAFEAEMIELAAVQGLGFGRGINVTA